MAAWYLVPVTPVVPLTARRMFSPGISRGPFFWIFGTICPYCLIHALQQSHVAHTRGRNLPSSNTLQTTDTTEICRASHYEHLPDQSNLQIARHPTPSKLPLERVHWTHHGYGFAIWRQLHLIHLRLVETKADSHCGSPVLPQNHDGLVVSGVGFGISLSNAAPARGSE